MADDEDELENEEEEAKPAKKKSKASADEDEDDDDDGASKGKKPAKKQSKASDDDDEEKPAKKKSKASADDDEEKPAKKSSMMYVLMGVGGVGLLLCCCCGGPAGYMFYADATKPKFVADWEKVGNWKAPDGRTGDVEFGLRFNGGGSGLYNNYPEGLDGFDFFSNFKWKAIDDKTVEITHDKAERKFWFGANKGTFTYVVSGDELTLTNTADKQSVKLKKAKQK